MELNDLTGKIIGAAMKVHRTLGPGFLESVYHQALAHELRTQGVPFESEVKLTVRYDGVIVGDFTADMVVDGRVVVELKAVSALTQAHEVQTVNCLTATGIEVGLLLNFGAASLEFKKKFRTHRPADGAFSL